MSEPIDVSGPKYRKRRFPWKIGFRFLFAWYDLWIGVYYDRKGRRLYILPLPCIGVAIWWDRLLPYEYREPQP